MESSGPKLRLLHLSDTHNLHGEIEEKFGPIPTVDFVLHTGDFTNRGSAEEIQAFNQFCGYLKESGKCKEVFAIFGNHEMRGDNCEQLLDKTTGKQFAKSLLPNCFLIDHELVQIDHGLKIFGSGWCPWHSDHMPGDSCHKGHLLPLWKQAGETRVHRFDEIPDNVDILMTHGPPFGIFDKMERTEGHWGGSQVLRENIERARPRAHLFGHLHEQRGIWTRDSLTSKFSGGVEYAIHGCPFRTFPAPAASYPCQLISWNAMLNHSGMEKTHKQLAGPPRLILASKVSDEWTFEVVGLNS